MRLTHTIRGMLIISSNFKAWQTKPLCFLHLQFVSLFVVCLLWQDEWMNEIYQIRWNQGHCFSLWFFLPSVKVCYQPWTLAFAHGVNTLFNIIRRHIPQEQLGATETKHTEIYKEGKFLYVGIKHLFCLCPNFWTLSYKSTRLIT